MFPILLSIIYINWVRVQEDAPTLNRDGGAYKYSRAFEEIVAWCLNKDPAKRPTAKELLQTPFFKGAKKKSYLINAILSDHRFILLILLVSQFVACRGSATACSTTRTVHLTSRYLGLFR